MRSYRYLDLITAAFVAVLLISNIASSAKIIDLGFAPLGIPLSTDAGTFLFPLSYIFGDLLTEVYGYARSRRIIWIGFGSLLLCSLSLAIVRIMPGEAGWGATVGQNAFDAILGSLATGGIVLASITGYLFGEFSNSVVLAVLKVRTNGRFLWLRTIGSTLVGQGLDTVGFVFVACLFGVFPWSIALTLLFSNYLFKVSIEVVFTPLTYIAARALKRAENEDVYDTATHFTPFRFS